MGTVICFFPRDRSLRSENLHPSRGVAASGFRPLCNIPHCCLPEESGPCLSSNVAVHPLRPATDRRFGEPLPHQLANQTRAHPSPINLWQNHHAMSLLYGVLFKVSLGYPPERGRLPTRYSPVRRCPWIKSTEASFHHFSLDLHVLGTPPALILSQDRTLV